MKKVISLVLAFVVLMSLTAGCGSPVPEPAAPEAPSAQAGPAAPAPEGGGEGPNLPLPEGANIAAVNQLPEKPLRIAFLSWQNNPFFEDLRVGQEAAAEYLKSYNCTVDYVSMGKDFNVESMVAAIEAAITKQYDGIAISGTQVGAESAVNKAVDNGIPVVIFIAASEREPTKRLCLIGQEPTHAGEALAKEMVGRSGGKGKYGIIMAHLGDEFHELRLKGFEDYRAANAPDMEMVGMYENLDNAETAYSLTKDMLGKDPDIEYIYVTGSGASGAGKAIQELGLTDKVGIYTFDLTEDNIKFIRSGEIYCAIDQAPFGQGFDSCTVLYNYLVTGEKPDDFLPVVDQFGTPENISELIPE